MIKQIFTAIVLLLIFTNVNSQNKTLTPPLPQEYIYKIIGVDTLKLSVYQPEGVKNKYPTIIFYFGGGWNGGSITQFEDQAKYFTSRGMVSVLVDYRVKNKHNTSPFEAVKDAKSAMRYVKTHAKEFKIDTNKIVAAGGSAGGHLAAATTMLSGLNEEGEDTSISTKANALVLFNPVVDNGPEGYGYDRIGDRYLEFSPMYNITKGAPPTIFFLGDKDKLIPVSTAKAFKAKMEAVGSRCEVFIFENQEHGFFNKGKQKNDKCYIETVYEADVFLESLGYLKGKPTIKKNKE
ncbi:acetyl esterase/lipase [Mariniflexile fucanivorans]|uniref:Acetyl esterase/lipase n=1 Tax=Mariniflexile fucanivorans TaxID=264023 RepID=A0A4R1RJN5_9FLAO|nr:alpha/beta hydrolase [Mariniflexile fucanivorans]TCL66199.1 acetyl esterase/lipase [Mariniflexile fucanivorans]